MGASTLILKPIHALIIGDEILSGKRQDKHLTYLINMLKKFNFMLAGANYVGDSEEDIKQCIFNKKDCILFSFGGIGATPDDRTRQAAASANNIVIERHPEAIALIEKQFGKDAYPKRVLMGELPKNAKLIPNTINNIPGFSLHDHHFMPGFPEMAWPMIEWVINHYYLEFSKEKTTDDQSLWIDDRSESTLIDLMRSIEKQFTDVRIYSLPKLSPNKTLEFGIKGDKQQVKNAMLFLKNYLLDEKISWRENK